MFTFLLFLFYSAIALLIRNSIAHEDVTCRISSIAGGGSTCDICPPGYYCPITNHGELFQYKCPQGSYCKNGIKKECPSGSYGNREGLSDEKCDGKCLPGFYCPSGSTSNRQNACGDRSVICPIGSKEPKEVIEGFYSYNSTVVESGDTKMQSATMSWQKRCEIGYYCKHGIRYQCPSGTFGHKEALKSVDECLACRSGYYCPSEPGTPSTHSKQMPCGSVDKYCPRKTGKPKSVDIGYFTKGGESLASGENGTKFRTSQEICPKGSYCVDGVKKLCPAGFWGGSLGMSFKVCSGFCPAGTYCTEGSDHPRECPKHSYSAEGWSICIPCATQETGIRPRCKTDRSCCFL